MAAKSKLDPKVTPQLVKFMRRCGLTQEEIAAELGITRRTLLRWQDKHASICHALKESGDFVDSLVEDSLLKRALGCVVIEEEFERLPNGKRVRFRKKRKTILPDVAAAWIWLKNRQRKRWQERPNGHEANDNDIKGYLDALKATAGEVWKDEPTPGDSE